ncbi:hypothetical protein KFL_001760150 [Klebsormidium nitens]|uniref:Uncharacterized protein n=1 Tax=Klebsormidium nitens TaxID=105231 RepID=A0A1Y1I5W2_KLENI|nr:hypothetical protein KFL_001760150 [Klebsormidium nitens]|eukprot:GAQ84106.1 hypothetical protein KFL_001760150 [Klebsormidium nitens]
MTGDFVHKLRMLMTFMMETGRDVSPILDLLREDYEDWSGLFFLAFGSDEYNEKRRELWQEHFYQHLIKIATSGKPPFTDAQRALVVKLWVPPGRGVYNQLDAMKQGREKDVAAHVMAVLSTLLPSVQYEIYKKWLRDIFDMAAWVPWLKDWLTERLLPSSLSSELNPRKRKTPGY